MIMLRVREIKLNYKNDEEKTLKLNILKKLGLPKNYNLTYKVVKKSLDARRKPDIYYVYEILCTLDKKKEARLLKLHNNDILIGEERKYNFKPTGTIEIKNPIIVVGSGPAGLFASLNLVKNGYPVVVVERGYEIAKRVKAVEEFWQTNHLNGECNIQFGEGGAGTFSDGKLNTLVNDKEGRYQYVMETFASLGANKEITYVNKPHIGTDVLRTVITNMRKSIERLDGKFLFATKLTDINIKNGKIESVVLNNQEVVPCSGLVLALGHSARDTFYMLNEKGLAMENKPFAVGLRIMHPQNLIDENQYGFLDSKLPAASYKLTFKASNGKGVYSFCMCPGGYVVNASSETNRLCINGMSYAKRDSGIANSALIVTVNETDYGTTLFAGVEFQRKLEAKAYQLGKGLIPMETYGDYKDNKNPKSLGKLEPKIKGQYHLANLNELLPPNLNIALKEGIENFDRKIKGFASNEALLCGIESRSSSPLRITRNEYYESNISGIYPCGEGAGYAGGITSAAIDGLKVSEAIMNKFKPLR